MCIRDRDGGGRVEQTHADPERNARCGLGANRAAVARGLHQDDRQQHDVGAELQHPRIRGVQHIAADEDAGQEADDCLLYTSRHLLPA